MIANFEIHSHSYRDTFVQAMPNLMYQIKSKDDKERVLSILEGAFYNVPGVMWMIKSKVNARKHLRMLLSVCLEEACLMNGAYLTSDRKGTILFYRLNNRPRSIAILLKKMFLLFIVIGIRQSLRVMRSRKIISQVRPQNGLYGWFIATDRSVRGCATALELKKEIFRLSDSFNEPVYAETTLQRIAIFYEKIGFKVYATIRHPYENFNIWFMRRDPHSNKALL